MNNLHIEINRSFYIFIKQKLLEQLPNAFDNVFVTVDNIQPIYDKELKERTIGVVLKGTVLFEKESRETRLSFFVERDISSIQPVFLQLEYNFINLPPEDRDIIGDIIKEAAACSPRVILKF